MRRAGDVARLSDDHPLKATLVSCISNEIHLRPRAEDLHERLKEVQRVAQRLTTVSGSDY